MITALNVELTICAVLLLHTRCQGITFHRSPFQITGNNTPTERLLCFYIGRVNTQPLTQINLFPSDLVSAQLTYKAGKEPIDPLALTSHRACFSASPPAPPFL